MERGSFHRVLKVYLTFYCLWTSRVTGQIDEERILFKETSESEKIISDYYWSSWSGWTDCSRPCDIGITFRQRTCLQTGSIYFNVPSDLCGGQSKEYNACNIDPCPPGFFGDYRAMQCSFFDRDLFYLGRLHNWKPYYGANENINPCALVCYPEEDLSLRTQLSPLVLDGTPCTMKGHKAICVEGKCEPIGCDGKLYSNLRRDHCGICGGENRACKTVKGSFKEPNITTGYTDVIRIPNGATHLNIVMKTTYDNAYLALKSGQGDKFYINGYGRINPPAKYELAGTTLDYDKPKYSNNETLETMSAPGPINEALNIMVLSREPHSIHIEYQYSISETQIKLQDRPTLAGLLKYSTQESLGEYREVIADRYTEEEMTLDKAGRTTESENSFAEFDVKTTRHPSDEYLQLVSNGNRRGSRNRHRGRDNPNRGRQTQRERTRANAYANTNSTTTDIGRQNMPVQTFYWVATYAPCSATCSSGLTVTYASCYSNTGERVRTSDCDPATKPHPKLNTSCVARPCDARWVASKWSRCSVTCGEGVQYRAVRCWRIMREGLDSTVANAQCDTSQRPETTRTCRSPGCGALWQTSDWGQCTRRCGGGTRTREVRCSVPGSTSCRPEDKPEHHERCNEDPCRTIWAAHPLSECTAPCTMQTRKVECLSIGARPAVPLGDDFCDPKKKYKNNVQLCGQDCDPAWVPQEWQTCTSNCGTKSREVMCVSVRNGEQKYHDGSECDTTNKPTDTAECRVGPCGEQPKWFSTEWSECSATCGKGVRTREITCSLNNAPAEGCDEDSKLSTQEQCESAACPSHSPDGGCTEDNPEANCQLAVQLSLCSHWYYNKACCHSCKQD